QTLLQDRCLLKPEACAAALGRNEDLQVSGVPELCQILFGEGVLVVVDRGALADAVEQVVGQVVGRIESHDSASSNWRMVSSGLSRCGECPAPATTDIEMTSFPASNSSATSPVNRL